jgi:alpha-1,2-mannosyltransferase
VALIAWTLGRRGAAGVLIGVACAIKPQLGLLLVWALLWREWRFAVGVMTGVVPLVAISVGLYGLHNHLEYLSVLSFLSRHGESFFPNNSVNGILNWYLSGEDSLRWHSNAFPPYNPIVYAGTMAASLAFLALIVAPPLLARGRRADLSDLGAAAICTVVASPVAWEHHYGILLPIFAVALKQTLGIADRSRKLVALSLLTLSWALVADFIPFAFFLSRTPLVVAQGYCFFGALLLLVVLMAPRGGQTAMARPVEVAA